MRDPAPRNRRGEGSSQGTARVYVGEGQIPVGPRTHTRPVSASVMGSAASPRNPCVEALTPSASECDRFGDRVLADVIS